MTALKLKYPILLEEPPPMAAKSLAALGKPSMKFLSPPAMVAPDVTEEIKLELDPAMMFGAAFVFG